MSNLTSVILPLLLLGGCGMVCKKVDVASAFSLGAERGLRTAAGMIPVLLPTLVLLGMLKASGLAEVFCGLISPLMERVGFPAGALPVVILRPLSGSAALGAAREVLSRFGVDSREGILAASVLAGGETSLYVLGLYLGRCRVRGTWKAVAALLCGYAAMVAVLV